MMKELRRFFAPIDHLDPLRGCAGVLVKVLDGEFIGARCSSDASCVTLCSPRSARCLRSFRGYQDPAKLTPEGNCLLKPSVYRQPTSARGQISLPRAAINRRPGCKRTEPGQLRASCVFGRGSGLESDEYRGLARRRGVHKR